MIAVPYTTVEQSIASFTVEISKYKSDLKAELFKLSNDRRINKNNRRYTKALLKIANNIITAKPATLSKYKKMFDRIVPQKS